MRISQISTGFIEVPGQISLNIYAQGCKLRCKNCQNPELQDFNGGEEITGEQFENILRDKILSSWVCYLGGDVIYQPEEFKNFNKIAVRNNYKVALYTGLYFEQVRYLLDDVSLVIDGPWEEENGGVVAETTNQRVWVKRKKNWEQVKFKNYIEGV